MTRANLRDASMSAKLLYSSFLVMAGIGYIAALIFLYMTHAGLDSKPGIDIADIVESYYGNRSGTRLEAAIRGPMKSHIKRSERDIVAAWVSAGASKEGYEAAVKPIVQQDCMACHNPTSSAALKIPDLSSLSGLQQVTKVDKGESIKSLVMLSHIHLFGISLVLFAVGAIFISTELTPWLKHPLIVLPFVAILADIVSWFLTKWYPLYAYVVVIGGALMGLAMGAQILISLYQMWLVPHNPGARNADRWIKLLERVVGVTGSTFRIHKAALIPGFKQGNVLFRYKAMATLESAAPSSRSEIDERTRVNHLSIIRT